MRAAEGDRHRSGGQAPFTVNEPAQIPYLSVSQTSPSSPGGAM